jgi:hypothetical protein
MRLNGLAPRKSQSRRHTPRHHTPGRLESTHPRGSRQLLAPRRLRWPRVATGQARSARRIPKYASLSMTTACPWTVTATINANPSPTRLYREHRPPVPACFCPNRTGQVYRLGVYVCVGREKEGAECELPSCAYRLFIRAEPACPLRCSTASGNGRHQTLG